MRARSNFGVSLLARMFGAYLADTADQTGVVMHPDTALEYQRLTGVGPLPIRVLTDDAVHVDLGVPVFHGKRGAPFVLRESAGWPKAG